MRNHNVEKNISKSTFRTRLDATRKDLNLLTDVNVLSKFAKFPMASSLAFDENDDPVRKMEVLKQLPGCGNETQEDLMNLESWYNIQTLPMQKFSESLTDAVKGRNQKQLKKGENAMHFTALLPSSLPYMRWVAGCEGKYENHCQSNHHMMLHSRIYASCPRQETVLQASSLQDDFYLNLLDWGSSDYIAVALGSRVRIVKGSDHTIGPQMVHDVDCSINQCQLKKRRKTNFVNNDIVSRLDNEQSNLNGFTAINQQHELPFSGEFSWDQMNLNDDLLIDRTSSSVADFNYYNSETNNRNAGPFPHSGQTESLLISPGEVPSAPQGNNDLDLRSNFSNNSSGSDTRKISSTPDISSLSWHPEGNLLAVGRKSGTIEIWDVSRKACLRTVSHAHTQRIGTLTWDSCPNKPEGGSFSILASGGRDKIIVCHDMRMSQTQISRWEVHRQEVCGIKWSNDWRYSKLSCPSVYRSHGNAGRLLASGGNDNKVYVWSLGYSRPLLSLSDHSAAVKALAWSPLGPILATGGGTNDRMIRIWDSVTGECTCQADSDAQVCNIAWNFNGDKIVTSHGYTQHTICTWNGRSLEREYVLNGHDARVLYMSQSADGNRVVTGAGDQTVRFWTVFN